MTRCSIAVSVLSVGLAIASVGYSAWRVTRPSYLLAMTADKVGWNPNGTVCELHLDATSLHIVSFVDRPYRNMTTIEDTQAFVDLWGTGTLSGPAERAVTVQRLPQFEITSASLSNNILFMGLTPENDATPDDPNCGDLRDTVDIFVDSTCSPSSSDCWDLLVAFKFKQKTKMILPGARAMPGRGVRARCVGRRPGARCGQVGEVAPRIISPLLCVQHPL